MLLTLKRLYDNFTSFDQNLYNSSHVTFSEADENVPGAHPTMKCTIYHFVEKSEIPHT